MAEGGVEKKAATSKLHFVLVHGIGGGGWCWYKLRCLMENSGCKVSCVDLKSAGVDPSDPNTLLSFEDYNKPLLDFLLALPESDDKVVLVGHSAGGLSITQASYRFPHKIHLVVYVGATMLRTGFSTDEDVKLGVPDLSEFGDNVYEFGFALGPDQPPTSAIIRKEFQRKILYHMSPQEDSTLAAMLLRPGPLSAILRAHFTPADTDIIDRVYIKTKYDRVVKPEQQDEMINKWPPSQVFVMETDHSPFFSSPFVLFGFLLKAADSPHCLFHSHKELQIR